MLYLVIAVGVALFVAVALLWGSATGEPSEHRATAHGASNDRRRGV
jgi:hypothetical protein